jgi:hypothetical protein
MTNKETTKETIFITKKKRIYDNDEIRSSIKQIYTPIEHKCFRCS